MEFLAIPPLWTLDLILCWRCDFHLGTSLAIISLKIRHYVPTLGLDGAPPISDRTVDLKPAARKIQRSSKKSSVWHFVP